MKFEKGVKDQRAQYKTKLFIDFSLLLPMNSTSERMELEV